MPQYKFYFLQDDGHVFRAEFHLLDDDLSALKAAEYLSTAHGIEIWESYRIVGRVKKGNEPLSVADSTSL